MVEFSKCTVDNKTNSGKSPRNIFLTMTILKERDILTSLKCIWYSKIDQI